MTCPILVLAFNRPEPLRILLTQLKTFGATNVYFAVDGPRLGSETDKALVAEVRNTIATMFLPTKERCLFRDENRGVRWAPPEAISWFLQQEEEGVILEDDCIPSASFLEFASWALAHYRNESRVMHISGFNRFERLVWKESHRFLKTPLIWGWATWRRAWEKYDPYMLNLENRSTLKSLRTWVGAFAVFDYWRDAARMVRDGRLVTWDIAWCWAVLTGQGLSVFPRVSLIENIGSGSDATHTRGRDRRMDVKATLLAPPYSASTRFRPDRRVQHRLDRLEFWRGQRTLLGRFRSGIRKLVWWQRCL